MTQQHLISESDRLAICDAADILKNLAKGCGATEEEARNACLGLLSINYVPVVQPVWGNGPLGAA